ncbi:hypothetical protein ACLUWW_02000 [Ligilactobacillus salivarius]|uniref:hypothetical protein n=1 Tax=Ligilactobacillus salivarius TaxID=1624 RepID=UPI003993A7FA
MEMNLVVKLANWLIRNWKDIGIMEIFVLMGWSILMYALYLSDKKIIPYLQLISVTLLVVVLISWLVGGAFALFVKLKEKD